MLKDRPTLSSAQHPARSATRSPYPTQTRPGANKISPAPFSLNLRMTSPPISICDHPLLLLNTLPPLLIISPPATALSIAATVPAVSSSSPLDFLKSVLEGESPNFKILGLIAPSSLSLFDFLASSFDLCARRCSGSGLASSWAAVRRRCASYCPRLQSGNGASAGATPAVRRPFSRRVLPEADEL